MAAKAHSIFDPAIIVPAIGDSFKKLNPVTLAKNPVMFVTEVGAADHHRPAGNWARRQFRVPTPDRALALVYGAVCELCRSDGRGARQGAGKSFARHADRDVRQSPEIGRNGRKNSGQLCCGKATSLWFPPANSFLEMAK